MCFEPSTPSRKYGVEYPERSGEIRFRKSVDFRKTMDLWISFIIQNNQDTKIFYLALE